MVITPQQGDQGAGKEDPKPGVKQSDPLTDSKQEMPVKRVEATPKPLLLAVKSIPALVDGEPLRTITAKDDLFSRTQLAVTYLPNTYVITKLGVAVTDQSKAIITAVGSIAVAAVGAGILGFDEGAPPKLEHRLVLPLIIDSTKLKLAAPGAEESVMCKFEDQGSTEVACGKVKYGPVSVDAISKTTYFLAVSDTWTTTIAVPACRRVSITMNKGGGLSREQILETVINDPNFVRVVRLPSKGSVSFHTSCGYDIATDDAKNESVWTVLDAIGTQVKAYDDAKAKQQKAK
jgi:hypothetical protein